MLIHLGDVDFVSRSLTAWYSRMVETAFTLNVSVSNFGSTTSSGAGGGETPALEMTTSMWSTPAALMSSTAFLGSVADVFSMLTSSSFEPSATGRAFSLPDWGPLASRRLPTTTWFGRDR